MSNNTTNMLSKQSHLSLVVEPEDNNNNNNVPTTISRSSVSGAPSEYHALQPVVATAAAVVVPRMGGDDFTGDDHGEDSLHPATMISRNTSEVVVGGGSEPFGGGGNVVEPASATATTTAGSNGASLSYGDRMHTSLPEAEPYHLLLPPSTTSYNISALPYGVDDAEEEEELRTEQRLTTGNHGQTAQQQQPDFCVVKIPTPETLYSVSCEGSSCAPLPPAVIVTHPKKDEELRALWERKHQRHKAKHAKKHKAIDDAIAARQLRNKNRRVRFAFGGVEVHRIAYGNDELEVASQEARVHSGKVKHLFERTRRQALEHLHNADAIAAEQRAHNKNPVPPTAAINNNIICGSVVEDGDDAIVVNRATPTTSRSGRVLSRDSPPPTKNNNYEKASNNFAIQPAATSLQAFNHLHQQASLLNPAAVKAVGLSQEEQCVVEGQLREEATLRVKGVLRSGNVVNPYFISSAHCDTDDGTAAAHAGPGMHASAALTFGALTDANARHRVGVHATTTALNDALNCQREQGGPLDDAPLQFVVSSMELYDLLLHELRDGWACSYSNNDNHHPNNNLRPVAASSSSCAVLPRLALDFVAAGALAAIERQEQQQLRTDLDMFYERLDDLEQYVAEELRALLEASDNLSDSTSTTKKMCGPADDCLDSSDPSSTSTVDQTHRVSGWWQSLRDTLASVVTTAIRQHPGAETNTRFVELLTRKQQRAATATPFDSLVHQEEGTVVGFGDVVLSDVSDEEERDVDHSDSGVVDVAAAATQVAQLPSQTDVMENFTPATQQHLPSMDTFTTDTNLRLPAADEGNVACTGSKKQQELPVKGNPSQMELLDTIDQQLLKREETRRKEQHLAKVASEAKQLLHDRHEFALRVKRQEVDHGYQRCVTLEVQEVLHLPLNETYEKEAAILLTTLCRFIIGAFLGRVPLSPKAMGDEEAGFDNLGAVTKACAILRCWIASDALKKLSLLHILEEEFLGPFAMLPAEYLSLFNTVTTTKKESNPIHHTASNTPTSTDGGSDNSTATTPAKHHGGTHHHCSPTDTQHSSAAATTTTTTASTESDDEDNDILGRLLAERRRPPTLDDGDAVPVDVDSSTTSTNCNWWGNDMAARRQVVTDVLAELRGGVLAPSESDEESPARTAAAAPVPCAGVGIPNTHACPSGSFSISIADEMSTPSLTDSQEDASTDTDDEDQGSALTKEEYHGDPVAEQFQQIALLGSKHDQEDCVRDDGRAYHPHVTNAKTHLTVASLALEALLMYGCSSPQVVMGTAKNILYCVGSNAAKFETVTDWPGFAPLESVVMAAGGCRGGTQFKAFTEKRRQRFSPFSHSFYDYLKWPPTFSSSDDTAASQSWLSLFWSRSSATNDAAVGDDDESSPLSRLEKIAPNVLDRGGSFKWVNTSRRTDVSAAMDEAECRVYQMLLEATDELSKVRPVATTMPSPASDLDIVEEHEATTTDDCGNNNDRSSSVIIREIADGELSSVEGEGETKCGDYYGDGAFEDEEMCIATATRRAVPQELRPPPLPTTTNSEDDDGAPLIVEVHITECVGKELLDAGDSVVTALLPRGFVQEATAEEGVFTLEEVKSDDVVVKPGSILVKDDECINGEEDKECVALFDEENDDDDDDNTNNHAQSEQMVETMLSLCVDLDNDNDHHASSSSSCRPSSGRQYTFLYDVAASSPSSFSANDSFYNSTATSGTFTSGSASASLAPSLPSSLGSAIPAANVSEFDMSALSFNQQSQQFGGDDDSNSSSIVFDASDDLSAVGNNIQTTTSSHGTTTAATATANSNSSNSSDELPSVFG